MQKIEAATPDDLEDILEIERESSSNPWQQSFFESEFTEKFSTVLVTRNKSDGKADGFIVFRTINDIAEINNIAVRVNRRRSGIGEGLIEYLIGISVKNKVSSIFLEVRSKNHPAIKMYEKFGFRLSGKRKDYYNHPKDDALIYKLEID